MGLKLVLFYGSVRSQRQGIAAARYVQGRCVERGHQAELIDAAEYPLPLLDRMYKEYESGSAPELLSRMADLIIPADAYIVVSGEYNHNVPPGLANLLDHFLDEYFWKPSAIVCYSAGAFGGVRASIALRSMLAELGMSSVPSVLPIPRVQDAFDAEGNPTDEGMERRAGRFLDELEWYATALRDKRIATGRQPPERGYCEAQQLSAARS